MQIMSFDPAVGDIATQLVDSADLGVRAGTAAMPLTAPAAAGGEEVSAHAAAAFAEEAAQLLALHQGAQLELTRAGGALAEIARMYTEVDSAAAEQVLAVSLSHHGLANALAQGMGM